MAQHIACGANYANIFRLPGARGRATQVTSCTSCHALGVSWSPDGRRIAYAVSSTIFVARRDGSGAQVVASGYSDPAWSPGGQELVVVKPDGLFRLRLRDGRTLQVTQGPIDERPDWSSRGTIAFVRRGGDQGLYVVRPDGRGLKRPTPPGTRPDSFATPSTVIRSTGAVARTVAKPERGDVVRVAWQPRR